MSETREQIHRLRGIQECMNIIADRISHPTVVEVTSEVITDMVERITADESSSD